MSIKRVPIMLLAVTLAAACSPDARLAGPDGRSPVFRNGAAFGAAYRAVMWNHSPAMTLVAVVALADAPARVEIEATAVVPVAKA